MGFKALISTVNCEGKFCMHQLQDFVLDTSTFDRQAGTLLNS